MNSGILLLSVLLAIPSAAAGQCVTSSERDMKVTFTGYKTPHKIGVKGMLTGLKSRGKRKAPSWQELVLAQTLAIDVSEASFLDSGDKARDAKITKFFFGRMRGQSITAKVTKIDEEKKRLTLWITMNGKTVNKVGMAYKYEDGKLRARGHIDLFDFAAGKALKEINKACFAKHEGKTWSDVMIGMSARFSACK